MSIWDEDIADVATKVKKSIWDEEDIPVQDLSSVFEKPINQTLSIGNVPKNMPSIDKSIKRIITPVNEYIGKAPIGAEKTRTEISAQPKYIYGEKNAPLWASNGETDVSSEDVVGGIANMVAAESLIGKAPAMLAWGKRLAEAPLAKKVVGSALKGATELGGYQALFEAPQDKPLSEKVKATGEMALAGGVLSPIFSSIGYVMAKKAAGSVLSEAEKVLARYSDTLEKAPDTVIKNQSMLDELRNANAVVNEDEAYQSWLKANDMGEAKLDKPLPKALPPRRFEMPAIPEAEKPSPQIEFQGQLPAAKATLLLNKAPILLPESTKARKITEIPKKDRYNAVMENLRKLRNQPSFGIMAGGEEAPQGVRGVEELKKAYSANPTFEKVVGQTYNIDFPFSEVFANKNPKSGMWELIDKETGRVLTKQNTLKDINKFALQVGDDFKAMGQEKALSLKAGLPKVPDSGYYRVKPFSAPSLPESKGIEPLMQEAKKYKTAEEFIKSQQPVNVKFKSALQNKDYMGGHEAPMAEDINAPIWDLTGKYTGNKLYPEDVYSSNASRLYSSGMDYDPQAISILQSVKDRPNAKITIYRAVPKEVKGEINAGDWVTIVRDYAKDHGESNLGNNYKIVKKEVLARDLFTDANSIHEFGYDPQARLRGEEVPYDLIKKHIGSEKPNIYSAYLKEKTDIWNKANKGQGMGITPIDFNKATTPVKKAPYQAKNIIEQALLKPGETPKQAYEASKRATFKNSPGAVFGVEQYEDEQGNKKYRYNVGKGLVGLMATQQMRQATGIGIKDRYKMQLENLAELAKTPTKAKAKEFMKATFGGGVQGIVAGEKATEKVAPETAIQKVMQALKEAKPIRSEQEKLYSEERARRVAKMMAVGDKVKGEQGYFAQLGTQKGMLPKAQFTGIREKLTQGDVDSLFQKVQDTGILTPYEKLNAQTALTNLLGVQGGRVPTTGELDLLREIFPPEMIKSILDKRTLGLKIGDWVVEGLNLPRAIMATADLSAPLRQGIFFTSRPKQFIPALGKMFKYAFSEKAYQGAMEKIQARPSYLSMRENKLALTDMSKGVTNREEQFMSNLAEKIPVFGKLARGSNRAYTGFLNQLRADVYDDLLKTAKRDGVDIDKEFKDVAKFINSATGRGSFNNETAKKFLVATNSVFFSPRLIASRMNLLNPVYYATLQPFARKEALKSLLGFAGTAGAVLGLAKLGGADIGVNPASADFGKIKVGNTRYDTLGGFQQYLVALYRLLSGKMVSSTTGKEFNLGEDYKGTTRADIVQRFFEGKAAPIASLILNFVRGKNYSGGELDMPAEVTNRMIPMLAQDMYDLYKENGMSGIAMGIPGAFGVGSQTYGDLVPLEHKTPKGKPSVKFVQRPGLGEDIANKIRGIEVKPIAVKSLYDRVQEAKTRGDDLSQFKEEINKLSDEDYARYKKLKERDKRIETDTVKVKIIPIYKKVQELKEQGNLEEAKRIVNELSDTDYRVYKLLKGMDYRKL